MSGSNPSQPADGAADTKDPEDKGPVDQVGGIWFDRVSGALTSSDRPVHLTPGEMQVFRVLLASPGTVFSRVELAEIIWGPEPSVDVQTINQKIRRIRSALSRGTEPDPIKSVRGEGYKFSERYGHDYAEWLISGKKRLHMSEIVNRRKRMGTKD